MGVLFVFDSCLATAKLLFATIRIQQAEGISAKSGAASMMVYHGWCSEGYPVCWVSISRLV
jgi:hypothetical protein